MSNIISKGNLIQVFEYEKLKLNNSLLNKKQFDALALFNEKNENKYFQIVHNGVKFTNYVGVIQVGTITIEILPKIDRHQTSDKKTWHNVLLDMLAFCKKINVDNISESHLSKRYNSILEIYYDIFLSEIEKLIRKGLLKKYRRIQGNQIALKGKVLFSKNLQKNLVHKENFYCEYQTYDKNHLIHQILFKALYILENLLPPILIEKYNSVKNYFIDIKKINVNRTHFKKITFNRKDIHYKKATDIAKMIILNFSPSITSGNTNMLTLLFDMNMLWEEYIYRVLNKHQKENNLIVSFQKSRKFWESKIIKPDIILKKNNKLFIIDTKWKISHRKKPDDSDLKQMFSYNLLWKAEKSLLLYPYVDQNDSEFGNYSYLPNHIIDNEVVSFSNQCKLGYIDIIESDRLKPSEIIAHEIFTKLEIAQSN